MILLGLVLVAVLVVLVAAVSRSPSRAPASWARVQSWGLSTTRAVLIVRMCDGRRLEYPEWLMYRLGWLYFGPEEHRPQLRGRCSVGFVYWLVVNFPRPDLTARRQGGAGAMLDAAMERAAKDSSWQRKLEEQRKREQEEFAYELARIADSGRTDVERMQMRPGYVYSHSAPNAQQLPKEKA